METDREFTSVVQLPGFPAPSIVTRRAASEDPDQATAETVERMQVCAIEDSSSPQVWSATQSALRGSATDRASRCGAIYRWIASHIKFRSDDPVIRHAFGLDNELDLLIRPARLLTMHRPAEDCDGFTMLACSMLLCAGVPCEIVTIKADSEDPGRFSHVYLQAHAEDGPICMDCSQAAQHGFPLGWEAPEYFDRQTWGVMHPEPKEKKRMQGLGVTFQEYGLPIDAVWADTIPGRGSLAPEVGSMGGCGGTARIGGKPEPARPYYSASAGKYYCGPLQMPQGAIDPGAVVASVVSRSVSSEVSSFVPWLIGGVILFALASK